MKKKLELYCSSFKASACAKPTALLMFILLIVVFTIALGFPMRLIFETVETKLFGANFLLEEIDRTSPVDYNKYKDIAEKLKPINDRNLFDKELYRSVIYMSCNMPSIIKQNGKLLQESGINVCLEISPYHFTQEEINEGVKKIVVSKAFFKKHDLKQGEKLIFEGSEFTVYENHKNDETLTIAYTAKIEDFRYASKVQRDLEGKIIGDVKFWQGKIALYGKQNIATSYELEILKDIGVQPYKESLGGIILPIIILIAIFIGGVVSILIVYNYILKINSRRYGIYKIIGMSPFTISGIMLSESLTLSGIGIGLGLMIEVVVNMITKIDVLTVDKLMWLHCVSLTVATMLATLFTVGFKIIAHAKAVPVAAKYLQ